MRQIVVSIDVEIGELGKTVEKGFEIFVNGQLGDGEAVGVPAICQTLEEFGLKGDFFVDVYPGAKKKQEQNFKQVCRFLLDRGHGLHLHTHPGSAFDPKRIYLNEYSTAEQREIIKLGQQLLQRWTGQRVTSHRAGAYAVNEDSFTAFKATGITLDASYLAENRHCLLKLPVTNRPIIYRGVRELPVTVFQTQGGLQKLDYRYGASVSGIVEAVRQSPEGSIVTLFLHSFNFLDLWYDFKRRSFRQIKYNRQRRTEFVRLLKELQKLDCQFCLIGELDWKTPKRDYLPLVKQKVSLKSKSRQLYGQISGAESV